MNEHSEDAPADAAKAPAATAGAETAPAAATGAETAPTATAGATSAPTAAAGSGIDGGQSPPPPEKTAQPASPEPAPPKKAPAKGTTAKKTTAKKAPAKKTPGRTGPSRAAAVSAQQAKFPRHSVERSLRIAKAIFDQNAGKPTTLADAAKFTTGGKASGPFGVEVSSAKKYGFLRNDGGRLIPEERARKVLFPQSESDRVTALREAVLGAPDLAEVYSHYRGENLPDAEFFTNALRDTFKIPPDKIPEFLEVFYESVRSAELLDENGERPRLVDVGRDAPVKPLAVPGPRRAAVASGSTCFVMQPFGGHLGTYYEAIFKPAIEKAGLAPLRADADIFATGKIMDQVWRGIRQATVLVAELTSKNPNVFYELGLAHAQRKPVILVSSNEDDVPFDLRHIRVILYDQHDPFWGQKLIDKIADNIKAALNDPEEAIFRIADE